MPEHDKPAAVPSEEEASSIHRQIRAHLGGRGTSSRVRHDDLCDWGMAISSLRAALTKAEEENTALQEQYGHNYLLSWRGIEPDDFCRGCGGSGWKTYGSTSTWVGGIGGQMMTDDVCDDCWGSGSRTHRWPSRRELRRG